MLSALVLGLMLAGLGILAQALLSTGVTPGPGLFLRLVVASLGAAAAVAVPLAALVGAASGARRVREEGAWLALQSLGTGPRALMRAALPVAVGAGLAYAVVSHLAEPAARALLRDTRSATVAAVRPREGHTASLGPWAVSVQDGRLFFSDGLRVGEAAAWALVPAAAGVVLVLERGELSPWERGATLSFERLTLPIRLPGSEGRVAVAERSSLALMGRTLSAYERWILWKRTLLPVFLVPMVLALVRGGLSDRPLGLVIGAGVLGLWGGVRGLDQAVGTLGPVLAAGILGSFGVLLALWARRAVP